VNHLLAEVALQLPLMLPVPKASRVTLMPTGRA
jgi:hypothetical protein